MPSQVTEAAQTHVARRFTTFTSVSQETSNSDHREQLGVGGKVMVRRGLPISSFADNLHLKVIYATGSRYGMGGTH